jgi:hypothetical protein
MNLYTVSLETVHIDNTRSRHEDTDSVSFTVVSGTKTPHTQSSSLGDVNNGDHAVNLSFTFLLSSPTQPLVLSYVVYNGGTSQLPQTLEQLTEKAADNALDDILNPDPPVSSASDYGTGSSDEMWPEPGSANVGWLTALSYLGIADFVFPDCDGLVALDTISHTVAQWDKALDASPNATFRTSIRYPGSNSSAGCGSNSDYTLTWSVRRERMTGSLRQFLNAHSLHPNPGLRSLS